MDIKEHGSNKTLKSPSGDYSLAPQPEISLNNDKSRDRHSKGLIKRSSSQKEPSSRIRTSTSNVSSKGAPVKSNSIHLDQFSTNERVLRQEIYRHSKHSNTESSNTLKPNLTNISEESSKSRQSLNSDLNSLNLALPNVNHDIRYTKLFLQKQGLHNMSIWSHLTDVLNKIIAEQPDNVIDYFEEYSRKVKQEKLILYDSFRDVYIPSAHLESAKNQLSLVNTYGIKEDVEEPVAEEEEANEPPKRMDLEEISFYFRQAGVVIPEMQLFTINIAIKKLTEKKMLVKPRFWGKIFGTKQDYFVLECELSEEEYDKRVEEDQAQAAEAARIAVEKLAADEAENNENKKEMQIEEHVEIGESKENEESDIINEEQEEKENIEIEEDQNRFKSNDHHEVTFDLNETEDVPQTEDPFLPPLPPPKKLIKYKIPSILQPVYKDIIEIPSEKIGVGLNKKVYFVCNTPELEWQELPKVTPEEINVARQIKVTFTGDLDSKIFTYPQFRGTEKNYLRAQIARISASTQVSPLGFYRFGGGEEEDEEEVPEEEEAADQTNYNENPNFQPIPIKELIDPSLASWVHHSQHILSQGRTDWWNPKKTAAGDEEAEEEQEEEEEEEPVEVGEEKEKGPPLLSPLSEDLTIEGQPAWTVRKTNNYNTDMAVAVIKSNLWPGATAFAVGKKFENVYFGWGHKYSPYGYSVPPLPHPEYEYDLGPEIMEIQDPTVEVEQAWRVAHKKAPPEEQGEGEEAEEGDEEEEEEEEDD